MQTDQEVDISILEASLNAPHCEVNHGAVPCSHTPVARLAHCKGSLLICLNVYKVQSKNLKDPYAICGLCKKRASNCWTITPL
jgi:hypothetical protein